MDISTIVAILGLIVATIGVLATVLSMVLNVRDKIEVEYNAFKGIFLKLCLLVVFVIIAIIAAIFLISNFNRPLDESSNKNEISSDPFDSISDLEKNESNEINSIVEIEPICLTSLKRVKFGCYTGNLGDSRLNVLGDAYEYGYGDVGVNGEVFKDGFEGWVARWNPVPEVSWVFAIYDLDDKYNSLSVSTGLIQSYNTKDFNTTLYFYGDDVDTPLYSQTLTNEEYKYNFNVDVTGVKYLKIMLKDNIAVKGGTSFALHNLYLT